MKCIDCGADLAQESAVWCDCYISGKYSKFGHIEYGVFVEDK